MPKLDRFCCNMEKPLSITTPLEEVFVAKYMYKSYVVRIKDKDTLADLVLFLMLDFDIILGIYLLASCFAKVDCHYKLVKFKFLGEPSFMIYGHNCPMFVEVMSTNAKARRPRVSSDDGRCFNG